MSELLKEKLYDLKNCINEQNFCKFKEIDEAEILYQEDYFKAIISTIGLYASVHPEQYLENKSLFYEIVLDLEKQLNTLREEKIKNGDIVETSKLDEDPTNSELLANSYGTCLYIFCAIDTMNKGKFNFNYFKGKYPKTTLRTLPLNCFNDLDLKLALACETDKKLFDNFHECHLKNSEKEFIINFLDSINIRGPELRMIVRAVCANNFKKVYTLCRVLSEDSESSKNLLEEFIANINANQTEHSTFKTQKLLKIGDTFIDATRPILTKFDTPKEKPALLSFADILSKLNKEELLSKKYLKPYLNENSEVLISNDDVVSDFDIKAIFTQNEINNLENLLKDPTQFNLYFSRLCLELRNFEPTTVSPVILDRLNMPLEKQKETAKKKDKIYSLTDANICVLDYIEASRLTPSHKLLLTKNILAYGNKKFKECFNVLIENSITNKSVDKIIQKTSSEDISTFFNICEILKTNTNLKSEIIKSINSDNDQRSLEQIKEDLERSKIDLDAIDKHFEDTAAAKIEAETPKVKASDEQIAEAQKILDELKELDLTPEELEMVKSLENGDLESVKKEFFNVYGVSIDKKDNKNVLDGETLPQSSILDDSDDLLSEEELDEILGDEDALENDKLDDKQLEDILGKDDDTFEDILGKEDDETLEPENDKQPVTKTNPQETSTIASNPSNDNKPENKTNNQSSENKSAGAPQTNASQQNPFVNPYPQFNSNSNFNNPFTQQNNPFTKAPNQQQAPQQPFNFSLSFGSQPNPFFNGGNQFQMGMQPYGYMPYNPYFNPYQPFMGPQPMNNFASPQQSFMQPNTNGFMQPNAFTPNAFAPMGFGNIMQQNIQNPFANTGNKQIKSIKINSLTPINSPASKFPQLKEQPSKEKPKEQPSKPAITKYVSRNDKLEDAFFKDMHTAPVQEAEYEAKPLTEEEDAFLNRKPQEVVNPDDKKSGEGINMSEEDFFADMNETATSETVYSDPGNNPKKK